MATSRTWPAPWLFSILILPFGIMVGLNFTPLPFLLAQAGVPVDHIARIFSIAPLPGVLLFLWSPIVDVKLRRRTWLAIATLATAASVCVYFPLIGAAHLALLTALIVAGGIAASFIVAACGGLMVRMLPAGGQAKASAWWQAGALGGGALGGAAVLWLATRYSLPIVGLCIA